ncbi:MULTISPECIES: Rap1a/Tai family immunity protein [unclassified Polynucleobacter]|uniref:Rap1a/Tai family immunity protein n=1 Tax=unclassified Polynucleobacter TaxID=2640945 RepID=UPI00248FA69F|nr:MULTISPECIES: Rap1a/Tai family immunity protein [unclassified Polynucleobacter]
MKFFYSVSILWALFSNSAIADEGLTVGRYLELKNKSEVSREYVTTYVGGIGQGVFFASVFGTQTLGNKPLLCPPNNLRLTGEITNSVFEKFLKNSSANLDKFPVGIVVADALRKEYPCK